MATAVVTTAIWRTWSVRLEAITLTESVRSFHVPATPETSAWPPSTPSVPTSRATPVTCSAKTRSVSVIELIVSASVATSPLASTVTFCVRSPLRDGRRHGGDLAHLVGQVGRHEVHVLGEVAPRAADALDLGLAAELAVGADLARDARDLVGEGRTAGRPSC